MIIYKVLNTDECPVLYVEKFFSSINSARDFIKNLDIEYNTDVFKKNCAIFKIEVYE